MVKANKSKHNSTGKLLNISRYTGGGLTPLVTADNREGVAAVKYYIREIYREVFGEEGPKWLKK